MQKRQLKTIRQGSKPIKKESKILFQQFKTFTQIISKCLLN